MLVRSSVPVGGDTSNLIKTIRQVTADEYTALPASEKNADTLYISKGSPYNVITIPPPPPPVIIKIDDIDLTDKKTIEYGRFYDCPANYSLPNNLFYVDFGWHQNKAQDIIVEVFHLNNDNTESKVSEYIGRGVINWYFGEQPGIKIVKYIVNPLGVREMSIGIKEYNSLPQPQSSNFELNKNFLNFFENLQLLRLPVMGRFVINAGILDCSELKNLIYVGIPSMYLVYKIEVAPPGETLYMNTILFHPEVKIQSLRVWINGDTPEDAINTSRQWWGKFSKIPENLADTTSIELRYSNISSSELDRMLIELDKAGRFNGKIEIDSYNNRNWNGMALLWSMLKEHLRLMLLRYLCFKKDGAFSYPNNTKRKIPSPANLIFNKLLL
ncbi:hypothetical protein [Pedobacter sp. NJ-S-72]